jgi:hypothetical protein
MNTRKAYSKRECPQKDLLRVEYYKVGIKKIKIIHLKKKNERKNVLIALSTLENEGF